MSVASSSQNTVIINTGCANISSVKFALQRLTQNVTVSDDPAIIGAADKLILPGVGSANAAMESIANKQLASCIQSLTQPVLGVCLGMQLMVTDSQEKAHQSDLGNTPCLNLIPGQVKRMQVGDLRLPHMGWNTVDAVEQNSIFKGIPQGTYFYFVHSFAVDVYSHTLAASQYGMPFSAAIHRDNFYGVQFHPERSGDAGATLLENFLNL
ncbi:MULTISPECIES: imidazole glycerol phosphate synthase subunit HisH [Alteromonadaceae]|uniref:imidazole glycerol phosphate synthase subunit HisH n=1 Tax=Alteromonadaceae TaxID=72275 RepID=UPI001C0903BB|nr:MULTISPECIES: imidazole glycerol phosphate synthase subunit HisH [Aliiglaciecola]MBU2877035.1 imidazole glycerol phosphate synthase subunit HisH [Aliiglaciecola lipolytica]MDO6712270.1 imidazole glycerol phosphate synthase subunit HisH [Aliiglaciecola sp. 2_MG-2023]MDO6753324.1 imidazole glycerol phosphate synthase subunit HisH [Aliiglaciecola sp. 1_MG-2023]